MKKKSLLSVFFLLLLISLFKSSEGLELAEYNFNGPYEKIPFSFGFFDTTQLQITSATLGGRLIQVSNPYTVTADSNPIGGAVEHVKFLQLTDDFFVPGDKKHLLRVTARMGAQHFNMSEHPFPSGWVTRPEDDVRLGSCALNAVSLDTFIVLDFMITNRGIYALYERLPFGRTMSNNYRAFTQIKRVADRTPNDISELSIQYDAAWGAATWYVDGKNVFSVTSLGRIYHGSGVRTIIDLGGDEETVSPSSFNFGFGCFTLLDAVDYFNEDSESGLVNLCAGYSCGYVTPADFYDEEDYLYENRLWGQGSALIIGSMRIDSF
jgi:hypothetical protein